MEEAGEETPVAAAAVEVAAGRTAVVAVEVAPEAGAGEAASMMGGDGEDSEAVGSAAEGAAIAEEGG